MFENFQAFLRNPAMYMMKARFNIPQNITNPDDIINHLLQSGQITQEQYNQVYSKYRDLQQNGQLPKQ